MVHVENIIYLIYGTQTIASMMASHSTTLSSPCSHCTRCFENLGEVVVFFLADLALNLKFLCPQIHPVVQPDRCRVEVSGSRVCVTNGLAEGGVQLAVFV